jgi:N-methylhydantoinase A/oxoprolinase/acetone carboxylase beta subunit
VTAVCDGADDRGAAAFFRASWREVVRYSTTVSMNRLIERKGPRLGLMTTEGHEDAILIGRGAQFSTAPASPSGATWRCSRSRRRSSSAG